jgi:hypothetical protein
MLNKQIHIFHGAIIIAVVGILFTIGVVYQINTTPDAFGASLPLPMPAPAPVKIRVTSPVNQASLQMGEMYDVIWVYPTTVTPGQGATFIFTDYVSGKIIGTTTLTNSNVVPDGAAEQLCTTPTPCAYPWTPTSTSTNDRIIVSNGNSQVTGRSGMFSVVK